MNRSQLVYIASPYAGDVKQHVAFAKAACRYAMTQGYTPIAVHLLYPQFLDDGVPEERKEGLRMGLRVLMACDELWLCGEEVSLGMEQEKDLAERVGIPIRCIPSELINVLQTQELEIPLGLSL
ncbi:DUF4406 domain-containing protein [bacterium 1XD21-13]|nr:DUF4406 domain-containing protein [bacterium 1XD21-13]